MRSIGLKKLNFALVLVLLFVAVPVSQASSSLPAFLPKTLAAPAETWELAATGVGGADFPAGNTAISTMATFDNRLYVGTRNFGGASILSSADGTGWSDEHTFGVGSDNNYVWALAEYDAALYAGIRDTGGGVAELWYSTDGSLWEEMTEFSPGANQFAAASLLDYENQLWVGCWANGVEAELWHYETAWGRETSLNLGGDNTGILALAEFEGDLYVGTENHATGAEVWRRDSTSDNWERVAQNGFGNPDNFIVYTMRVYKDVLYAGVVNLTTGAELYATRDGVSWELIFDQGFDNPANEAVWNLIEADGYLYLAAQNNADGGRVYRTTDGRNWTPVSLPGFGDSDNTVAWGAAVFEGTAGLHLYVGTQKATGADIFRTLLPQPEESWEQVEQRGFDNNRDNEAIVDYVEFDGDLYAAVENGTDGAQVWRSSEGRTWTQVGADNLGDPGTDGTNSVAYALTVHDNDLYVGTANAAGAFVYRWDAASATWVKASEQGVASGVTDNTAVYAMASFSDTLFAGTQDTADRAAVYRYSGSGTNWSDVSPPDGEFGANNDRIRTMVVYDGYLYMGTDDSLNGGDIWRCMTCDGTDWEAIDTDGQSTSNNVQLRVLYPFNGYLYAGYQNGTTGGQIFRSQTGEDPWTLVNHGGFGPSASGDSANSYILSMAEWDGYLYAGTGNFTTGGEVWRTMTGTVQADWEQVNTDGFSYQENRGVYALETFGPHLYAGTMNDATAPAGGAEVWRTGRPDSGPTDPCCEVVMVGIEVDGACWIRVNGTDTIPIRADSAGVYDVPLKGAGTYDITVEYSEGNLLRVQPITVILGDDGALQIMHEEPTVSMSKLAPMAVNEAWIEMNVAPLSVNDWGVIAMRQFGTYLYASTYDENDGAHILRSPDGESWGEVTTGGGGFGHTYNIAINGLVEYDGVLYAGTTTDLGTPPVEQAELYESSDGSSWSEMTPPPGLGSGQTGYQSLLVHDSLLWAGCDVESNNETAQLFYYNGSAWNVESMPGFDENIDADGILDNGGIYAMVEFQGDLYIGTKNFETGAQVWRRNVSDGSWTKVAQNGFGDPNNWYIYAMTVYNDALYVGTVNFFTGAQLYVTRDGASWETVFTDGFDDPTNVAVWQLLVSNGYLYLGTQNAAGGRLYRTVDGSFWTPVNLPGFGKPANTRVYGMATFNAYLYAGTYNATDGAEIWRTSVPQPQESWEQVERRGISDDTDNYRIESMVEHDDAIYASTYNYSTGGQVWKSYDGRTWVQIGPNGLDSESAEAAINWWVEWLAVHDGDLYAGVYSGDGARIYQWLEANTEWDKVNADGFGTANNLSAVAMTSFDGSLYACTANPTDETQLFRYTGSKPDWDPVPITGIEDNNDWCDTMTVYGSYLYVGTYAWNGGEVWRYDGSTWESVTTNGFGDPNNTEVRTLQSFDGYLYAGLENQVDGGEVWRSATGASGDWEQVNTNGFGRGADNPNNVTVPALAEWNSYLYASTRSLTPTLVYNESFSTNGGFVGSGTNSSWAYGAPTTGPGNAHSGTNVWATNLTGPYNDDEESYLTSPIIDLSSHSGDYIFLSWWRWLDTEYGYDFASVDVTRNNGSTWETVYGPVSGYQGGWFRESVVLDPSYATNQFRLRFYLDSDWVFTDYGWYVDDIQIRTGSTGTGAEVWRTAGGDSLDQSGWEQVSTEGFGKQANLSITSLQGFGDHIYAGTENVGGAEIWRSGLPGVSGERFAQVINASLRTDQACNIDVTGAAGWSHDALARGIYAIPLPEAGLYKIACGCGEDLNIYLDTAMGPQLDHFTLDTISDQTTDYPFPITLEAWAFSGETETVAITGTVWLTDTTGTISPTSILVTDTTSIPLDVTIGVSQTNVVITPSFGSVIGRASNPFTVTDFTHFRWDTIGSPQAVDEPFAAILTAENGLNGIVSSYNSTATLSANVGGVFTPTVVTFTSGVAAFDMTMGFTGTAIVVSAEHPTDASIVGDSNPFTVTDIPLADHFTFDTIDNQTTDYAFPVTLHAWADPEETTPIAVTGTIMLVDSTATLDPTSVEVMNVMSVTFDVTVGVSQTNVVITPSLGSRVGHASNPFDVTDFTHFEWATINSPQGISSPFAVSISARNALGDLVSGYNGTADLSASMAGTFTPSTASFTGGLAAFDVTIEFAGTDIVLTATHPTESSIVGASNPFIVTEGPILDHFTFDTINDQVVDEAFSIAVNAIDNQGDPIVITDTVALADSTGTLSPTTVDFANQSSSTINVTIGITATDVVLTATLNTITGTSNPFAVTLSAENYLYLPLVLRG